MRRLILIAAVLVAAPLARADAFRPPSLSSPSDYYAGPARVYRWTRCDIPGFDTGGCLRFYADQGVERATGLGAIRFALGPTTVAFAYQRPGYEVLHTGFRFVNLFGDGALVASPEDFPATPGDPTTFVFRTVAELPDVPVTDVRLGAIEYAFAQIVREEESGIEYLSDFDGFTPEPVVSVTPEPGTWALFGLGLGVVGVATRKRCC
jgi:hypothetical protein